MLACDRQLADESRCNGADSRSHSYFIPVMSKGTGESVVIIPETLFKTFRQARSFSGKIHRKGGIFSKHASMSDSKTTVTARAGGVHPTKYRARPAPAHGCQSPEAAKYPSG